MAHDIYIEALKYGSSNLIDGVDFSEFRKHMESLGYRFEGEAKEKNLKDIFNSVFGPTSGGGRSGSDRNWMEMEAYFRYIEHQELSEARASSKRATWLAILAIILSIVAASISYLQSSKPVTIEPNQFKNIQDLKYDPMELEELLIDLTKNTIKNNTEVIELLRELIVETKSNKPTQPTAKRGG